MLVLLLLMLMLLLLELLLLELLLLLLVLLLLELLLLMLLLLMLLLLMLLLLLELLLLVLLLLLLLRRSGCLLGTPQVLHLHIHGTQSIFGRFVVPAELLHFHFQFATSLATIFSALPHTICTFRPIFGINNVISNRLSDCPKQRLAS
jgi:hypothetical protein